MNELLDGIIEDVKFLDDSNDLLDAFGKARQICSFLELEENKEILSNNNLIAIYGEWGSGKSCLMKTIEKNIDSNKFETLWFDTWKYEKDDNLPYSLFKFITEKKNILNRCKNISKDILEIGYGIFKSIAKGTEASIGGPILNVTIKSSEAIDSMEKTIKDLNDRNEKDKCLWEKIEWFENEFKKLQVTKNKKKRLIVFLDDLDRCESENIINLLSSIKQLMAINPNIIFILGIDKEAVTAALKNKYSNDVIKAEEYLEKIFPITFECYWVLKNDKFCNYVSQITDLSYEDASYISEFLCYLEIDNIRQIKKIFRKFYFIKSILKLKEFDLTNKYIVIFVVYNIILNMFYNDEYRYLLLPNPEKKYRNILFYTYNNDVKKYYTYDITQGIGYLEDRTIKSEYLLKFMIKFSTYKLLKNELQFGSHINYSEWKTILEDNICKRFIDFVIIDKEFRKLFISNNSEKIYNQMIDNLSEIM